jgi:two-component system chemotaxis response regulator CheB
MSAASSRPPAVGRDLVVIGASAGGVQALARLVADLPADLAAAVCVVMHMPAGGRSVLAHILDRAGGPRATQARDGTALRTGQIYVAPPDHHMLVDLDHVRLTRDPPEDAHRPAINPLFRSAARAYGPRVIGVVLTGMLHDGAAGLAAVRDRGGATLIQDPDDALYDAMPRAAIAATDPDGIVPLDRMAARICRLVEDGCPAGPPARHAGAADREDEEPS